jgi:hypothetical protein
MAQWLEFADAEPELADWVKARFTAHRHSVLATLRPDGAPRISAIELDFHPDEVQMGCIGGTVKVTDLRRDPRIAVHCPTGDDDQLRWNGDAKLAGTAHEIPAERPGSALFRLDLTEVVTVRPHESGDYLIFDVWRPDRGRETRTQS